jgi:hypothetical protein
MLLIQIRSMTKKRFDYFLMTTMGSPKQRSATMLYNENVLENTQDDIST